MRAAVLLTFAATLGASELAYAQAKKPPAPATGVRYFTYLTDFMDGQADIILKENRTATGISSATFDLCFPAPYGSDRRDRIVTDLKINGTKLTGSGTSIGDKTPVEFDFTQVRSTGKVNEFDFAGTIKIGGRAFPVASKETADSSEKEFQDNKTTDTDPVAAPENYVDVSPEALAVRLKIDAVADFLKNLRGKSIYVSRTSLAASCDNLRDGQQTLQLIVNPVNAPAVLAQIKAQPGVLAAGWTSGSFEMGRTLRFPAKDWLANGKIDNAKLGASLLEALKQQLGATTASATWNENNGKHTLKFKRANPAYPGLGLTEDLEFNAIATFEKPGKTDNILLWLDVGESVTSDENSSAPLLLTDAAVGHGEEPSASDNDALTAVARHFKAQRWDDVASQFK